MRVDPPTFRTRLISLLKLLDVHLREKFLDLLATKVESGRTEKKVNHLV
jgi:hypothetical protein